MRFSINDLIGNADKFKFGHRVLNASALLGIILTLTVAILNYSLQLNPYTYIFPFISFFIFICIHIYSLKTKKYTIVYCFFAASTTLIFIPSMWFLNNGSAGGSQYFIPLFLTIIITTSPKNEKWIFSSIILFITIALLILEYNLPQYVIGYSDELERVVDLIIGFSISLITIFIAIEIFMNIYKKTHEKLNEQNKLLKQQNIHIYEQNEKIKTQTEELKTNNEKLMELSEFKQGMTNMIVHDLKNPLNMILNGLDKNTKRQRISMQQAGNQMLNMVMNILDVNKYEETEMLVDFKKISVNSIAQKAIEQIEFLAIEKNIKIENQIPTNINILADSEITERIFINIINNAVKYVSVNGEVKIFHCETEKRLIPKSILNFINENKNFTAIGIFNNGKEIPEDKKSLVFEKFGQIMAKESGKIPSTGLGLTFCKMAVEAHGGIIDFESKENEGVAFWFTLPKTENTEEKNEFIGSTKYQLKLSKEVIEKIKPQLEKLHKTEIYEITALRKILIEIEETDENIKKWKEQVENSVNAFNENEYNSLINL